MPKPEPNPRPRTNFRIQSPLVADLRARGRNYVIFGFIALPIAALLVLVGFLSSFHAAAENNMPRPALNTSMRPNAGPDTGQGLGTSIATLLPMFITVPPAALFVLAGPLSLWRGMQYYMVATQEQARDFRPGPASGNPRQIPPVAIVNPVPVTLNVV